MHVETDPLSKPSTEDHLRAHASTQAHKRVQQSRPEGYQTEVEVAYRVEDEQSPLEIRGRIDGLYATPEVVVLEEIKSTTLSLYLIDEWYNRISRPGAVLCLYIRPAGASKCACRRSPDLFPAGYRVEKDLQKNC
jgi:hypothetical protein